MKSVIISLFFFFGTSNLFAQYEKMFSSLQGKAMFKPVPYKLVTDASETVIKNGKKADVPYGYQLRIKNLNLKYYYSKQSELTDSSCSKFILFNQEFKVNGFFENNFACDLDVRSFKVYDGTFNKRKYFLVTGITNGSGNSATTIICFLFDITNKEQIQFYPTWSKYGSENCFGDFNKDGKLDFLKVRYYNGQDNLKINLTTLTNNKFTPYMENKKFVIAKYEGTKLLIIKKDWF